MQLTIAEQFLTPYAKNRNKNSNNDDNNNSNDNNSLAITTAMFVHATDNGMVIWKHCNCLLGPNRGLMVLSGGCFHLAIKF